MVGSSPMRTAEATSMASSSTSPTSRSATGAGDRQDAGQGGGAGRRNRAGTAATVAVTVANDGGQRGLSWADPKDGAAGWELACRPPLDLRDPLAGSARPGSQRQRKSFDDRRGTGAWAATIHDRAMPDHRPPDRAATTGGRCSGGGRPRRSPRGPDPPPSAAASLPLCQSLGSALVDSSTCIAFGCVPRGSPRRCPAPAASAVAAG